MDFRSHLLWSALTLLNLHCRSISHDYTHQTTIYGHVDYCTRRCNVLFAGSLYYAAIFVYRVTGHIGESVSCALTGNSGIAILFNEVGCSLMLCTWEDEISQFQPERHLVEGGGLAWCR